MDQRCALIVAHPGHEVLLHGWLEHSRAKILILTDGSGRAGHSRIDSARAYVAELKLTAGSIFGRFRDLEVYQSILDQDFGFFRGLAEEICAMLLGDKIVNVVGDAAEGYNSVHDLCRLLINCAVKRANRISGRTIGNFDFPVVGGLSSTLQHVSDAARRLELDQATFGRKLSAARKYYPELTAEVEQAIAGNGSTSYQKFWKHVNQFPTVPSKYGVEKFRTECLKPVPGNYQYETAIANPPYYELAGEQRASAGLYQSVIRHTQHLLPIAEALRQHATARIARSA